MFSFISFPLLGGALRGGSGCRGAWGLVFDGPENKIEFAVGHFEINNTCRWVWRVNIGSKLIPGDAAVGGNLSRYGVLSGDFFVYPVIDIDYKFICNVSTN